MLNTLRHILLVSACLIAIGVEATDTLRITLVGDILLDRGVRKTIDETGADALFTPSIDSLFKKADMVVANLECPATLRNTPQQKPYIFRAEPEMLTVLQQHGITHLNLANNHSIDQGREGLVDTYNNIRAREGLTPLGAGHNMAEAAQPVLLNDKPRKVWILVSNRLTLENFAYLPSQPSISQEPFDSLCQRVQQLRSNDATAYIIVYPHWGREHNPYPSFEQRWQARQLINAGADIIVGHHPHCIQQQEVYRGRHIFYSIGNFIFDQSAPLNSAALAVSIVITDTDAHLLTDNVWIHHCCPAITTHGNEPLSGKGQH